MHLKLIQLLSACVDKVKKMPSDPFLPPEELKFFLSFLRRIPPQGWHGGPGWGAGVRSHAHPVRRMHSCCGLFVRVPSTHHYTLLSFVMIREAPCDLLSKGVVPNAHIICHAFYGGQSALSVMAQIPQSVHILNERHCPDVPCPECWAHSRSEFVVG